MNLSNIMKMLAQTVHLEIFFTSTMDKMLGHLFSDAVKRILRFARSRSCVPAELQLEI